MDTRQSGAPSLRNALERAARQLDQLLVGRLEVRVREVVRGAHAYRVGRSSLCCQRRCGPLGRARTLAGVRLFSLAALLSIAACRQGGPAAAVRPQPTLGGECDARDPLTVEWSAPNRGRFESLRGKGLIAVRYHECRIDVLDCHATGKYAYVPLTPKDEQVKIRDKNALYANLPMGAASLEAKLQTKGELDVDMRVVGRFEFERPSVRADELTGDCDGATHVVTAMTVGAFKFFAGGSASMGTGASFAGAGVGASSDSSRELLANDGDPAQCAKATGTDTTPPYACGALLRLELGPVELTAQERCNRAGARLVSCGVPFDAQWSAKCPTYPSFPSCAKAAGDDCNKLSVCSFKAWGGACVPSGTKTCLQVAECYNQCNKNGSGDDCICACSMALNPARATALLKHNTCYVSRCIDKCGKTGSAACDDCFVKNCAAEMKDCYAN